MHVPIAPTEFTILTSASASAARRFPFAFSIIRNTNPFEFRIRAYAFSRLLSLLPFQRWNDHILRYKTLISKEKIHAPETRPAFFVFGLRLHRYRANISLSSLSSLPYRHHQDQFKVHDLRDVVNGGHGSRFTTFLEPQAQCEDAFCVTLNACILRIASAR